MIIGVEVRFVFGVFVIIGILVDWVCCNCCSVFSVFVVVVRLVFLSVFFMVLSVFLWSGLGVLGVRLFNVLKVF